MQKKQILIRGKILNYYEYKPLLTSPYQGEGKSVASSHLNKERIERGPVLLFLHGWMQDGKSFEGIFKILEANNIPYISLDLPGFGSSQLLHDDMNLDDYSRMTQDFIEKMQLINPVLLGHSFGGRICINLGSYYANISKIVLLCAAGVQRKIPTHKYFIIKTGKIVLSLPGLRKIGSYLREGLSSPDLKNAGKMTKIFRNTIAQDIRDKMKLVSLPTLMIWGKYDDQTPVADGEIIHSLIKNSEFHVLDGSHFVHQEKSGEITNMILKFIKK